ncbi:MAG TPA: PQQ-binding-like beta-propeller repeat protein [Longimicrobiales bacterium]|nr:PQQ-binding-like beta-propeller repeat protein [Longimicrobiales bacterium]
MGRLLAIRPAAALMLAVLVLPAPSAAQSGVDNGEWRVYGGDPGHTRYSSLDQIDASNAADLEIAWRFTARNFGPNPFAQSQTTPLYVDGILYATLGQTRNVVAIDPATGELLWMWRNPEGEDRLDGAPRLNSGRGVAYWTDGQGDERIIVFTPGYQLAALDAHTGYPVPEFGEDGMVDLFEYHRTREGVSLTGTIGSSSPVAVIDDMLVVGSAHHVGMRPPSMVNTPGDVLGIDARTGELEWTFKTIPEQGEPGNETWLEDSWTFTGNAAVWAQISWDPELGYVYLPTEAATGDYYGGHRPGDNLFSTSIVALEAATGRRVWHYQTIHHDIWDWDNTTAPILADVTIDGRQRQILAQISKQGFVYVLDRVTGEPIWPIEERPVPQGDVPGEWYSPTQPFPTNPAPFERQGFSEDDLIDFTPEIFEQAKEVASQFRWGPLYSPPSLRDAPDGTQGTITLPAATGGANWEGGALDPVTDYLYVSSVTAPSFLSLVPGGTASDMNYVAGGGRGQIAPGVSIVKPPWGRITAIDLKTGEHVWMRPNGETPDYVAERLEIDPSLVPNTGRQSRAGLAVTATVLIAGEGQNGGPNVWILDKSTGERLARIDLPGTQVGLPMTYMHAGRQYVVMSVSEGGQPAQLVALALPQ